MSSVETVAHKNSELIFKFTGQTKRFDDLKLTLIGLYSHNLDFATISDNSDTFN